MALSRKQLAAGENVVIHTRTHGKALVVPGLLFVVICFLAGLGIAWVRPNLPEPGRAIALVAIAVLAVVGICIATIAPFLRWLTTTFTVTNRRLITRSGIFTTRGHDLPLTRINNVEYTRSLLDRMLGCGTLQLMTAAEEPLTLDDVPDVERVHTTLTDLIVDEAKTESQP